ncbi:hypothetical protein DEU56DRAFT_836267 [Suillus clintonianus]|uniref:uncharacterized protein n=1 Tax=Suillus clintonianus TaxID=1904413 RepID=UPI001B86FE19|nr:uncharacterized protein DEU56DRAFT_836267 [Suillus clintonianus]KAG2119386.1 hypothetical protein DEU56DRAFT_836267 [Suillus clintonianus]
MVPTGSPVIGMTRVPCTNVSLTFIQPERLIELLGLKHGYKGRAIKITIYHPTFIISVSSTMSYPEAGIYLIQSSSKPDIYASVHHGGQNVLRGESFDTDKYYQRWRLDYVAGNQDRPQVFCALTKVNGEGGLGVNSIYTNQAVYSLNNPQSWFLSQTDEGYLIGQISDDVTYTWTHHNKGDPITIVADGSQSWQFVPEN